MTERLVAAVIAKVPLRQAFLGDGLPVNWTIQRRHFASFTPILDFVHARESNTGSGREYRIAS
jgi:hypothetical protein